MISIDSFISLMPNNSGKKIKEKKSERQLKKRFKLKKISHNLPQVYFFSFLSYIKNEEFENSELYKEFSLYLIFLHISHSKPNKRY